MSVPAREIQRPVPIDRVGTGLVVTVEATGTECDAVARRLMVPSVEALECRWALRPAPGGTIEADGSLRARLHQECVVSLEPFAVELVEEFAVRFVRVERDGEEPDDPDEPDELLMVDDVLELGEATVEQFALALDPYPRQPGATLPEDVTEASLNPFAALAKRRPFE